MNDTASLEQLNNMMTQSKSHHWYMEYVYLLQETVLYYHALKACTL